jgi:RNA-directed DNA polymerase
MDGKELFPTNEGTPQGGVISPLLANIALHGMEERIKELSESFNMKNSKGKQISKRDKRNSTNLIRYADDLVILHESEEAIHQCHQVITEWLKEMGLELKPSKTRIAHTLESYRGKEKGFDFLGFHIWQYKAGKCRSGKSSKGNLLGFKTQISPTKKAHKRHYAKVAEVIEKHRGKSQSSLIKNLNPIINGWCNYFKPYQCKEVFSKMDSLIWWKLWKWGKHRHRNKGEKWLRQKYWHTIKRDSWVFSTREHSNPYHLIKHSSVSTNIGYIKVKGDSSPYNGDLIYWSSRMGKNPLVSKRTATLLKRQKGICPYCGLHFQDGDTIELDHIIPKSLGGKNEYKNWQLLHRHCHDSKTSIDGSYGNKSDCNSVKPKPLFNIPKNYQWVQDMLVVT